VDRPQLGTRVAVDDTGGTDGDHGSLGCTAILGDLRRRLLYGATVIAVIL
jgi:hypothetical protein